MHTTSVETNFTDYLLTNPGKLEISRDASQYPLEYKYLEGLPTFAIW